MNHWDKSRSRTDRVGEGLLLAVNGRLRLFFQCPCTMINIISSRFYKWWTTFICVLSVNENYYLLSLCMHDNYRSISHFMCKKINYSNLFLCLAIHIHLIQRKLISLWLFTVILKSEMKPWLKTSARKMVMTAMVSIAKINQKIRLDQSVENIFMLSDLKGIFKTRSFKHRKNQVNGCWWPIASFTFCSPSLNDMIENIKKQ